MRLWGLRAELTLRQMRAHFTVLGEARTPTRAADAADRCRIPDTTVTSVFSLCPESGCSRYDREVAIHKQPNANNSQAYAKGREPVVYGGGATLFNAWTPTAVVYIIPPEKCSYAEGLAGFRIDKARSSKCSVHSPFSPRRRTRRTAGRAGGRQELPSEERRR